MRTVLVTGGNGFIGSYVVEELVRRGYDVSVLDTRYRANPLAQVVLGDTRDVTAVTEAVAHADGVIHLAGVLGTQETIANPWPAAETNILGGLNVLRACDQYDVPLVNIAVGNFWENNTYSITKNTIERFVDMFGRYQKSRMTSVRALNAYGPRQSVAEPFGTSKVRKIMPSFACRALSGMPIEVYGDGLQVMDMIYVADVAHVLVSALETVDRQGAILSPIEAGTGRRTTVKEIAQVVAETASWVTQKPPVEIVHLPMRKGETENSVVLGDPATLRQIGIGDYKLMPLEDGVARSVAYFQDYLSAR